MALKRDATGRGKVGRPAGLPSESLAIRLTARVHRSGREATVSKRAFAASWNPIARQYGLTTYQRNQL